MDYGMQGRAQLPIGLEQRGRPISTADPLDQEILRQGGHVSTGTASAPRSPATARGGGRGILPYDEEFYEVFSEIRLP